MFGSRLDIEQAFGQAGSVTRTRVRRRRFVSLCVIAGVLAVLWSPVAHAVGIAGGGSGGPSTTYVVRGGDTLWSIANRFRPSTDPRLVVDRIAGTNGIDPAALVPGQQLTIPEM